MKRRAGGRGDRFSAAVRPSSPELALLRRGVLLDGEFAFLHLSPPSSGRGEEAHWWTRRSLFCASPPASGLKLKTNCTEI